MPGKQLTLEQIKEAVTLRAAGYTLIAISESLCVSVSTLQRAFKRHKARKGSIKQEAIDKASKELSELVTSDGRLKEEAARIVADDLAQARLIRAKAALATEALGISSSDEAARSLRALVAHSTLLKNTSDTLRKSLRLNRLDEVEKIDELPELIIREYTAAELEAIQNRKQLEEID